MKLIKFFYIFFNTMQHNINWLIIYYYTIILLLLYFIMKLSIYNIFICKKGGFNLKELKTKFLKFIFIQLLIN